MILMEDRFAFIAEQAIISDEQEQLLRHSGFHLEDHFPSDDSELLSAPLDSTGILICSPPKDSEDQYQTPQEHLEPGDQRKEDQSSNLMEIASIAVDLKGDTDLVFLDAIASQESTKDENLEPKLGFTEKDGDAEMIEVSGVEQKIGSTEILDDVVVSVEKDGILEANSPLQEKLGFCKDTEMNEVAGEEIVGLETVESDGVLLKEAEKEMGNEKDKDIDFVSQTEEPTGGTLKLPNWLDEFGEKGGVLGRGGGRDERLGKEGSSAPVVEVAPAENSEANGLPGPGVQPAESSVQQFVSLLDLVDVEDDDEDDILVAAIKAGMKFPRPRWWRPGGYGRRTSS